MVCPRLWHCRLSVASEVRADDGELRRQPAGNLVPCRMRPWVTVQQHDRRPFTAMPYTKPDLSHVDELDVKPLEEAHTQAFPRRSRREPRREAFRSASSKKRVQPEDRLARRQRRRVRRPGRLPGRLNLVWAQRTSSACPL